MTTPESMEEVLQNAGPGITIAIRVASWAYPKVQYTVALFAGDDTMLWTATADSVADALGVCLQGLAMKG